MKHRVVAAHINWPVVAYAFVHPGLSVGCLVSPYASLLSCVSWTVCSLWALRWPSFWLYVECSQMLRLPPRITSCQGVCAESC